VKKAGHSTQDAFETSVSVAFAAEPGYRKEICMKILVGIVAGLAAAAILAVAALFLAKSLKPSDKLR
jgi:hypothetical protein